MAKQPFLDNEQAINCEQDKIIYRRADLDNVPHLDTEAGKAPFVRGPYETMYRHKPWTIRQYTGASSAAHSNEAFHRSLAEGGQGLSVAFDLPTHLGFDTDHPAAAADVGRSGVAIDSVEDMKRLFDGIDLGKVSVSMTMNGAVLPIMAAFIVAAEEQGVELAKLRGTLQNDILKEFMVRNTYIHGPDASLRISADIVDHLSQHLPKFNSMSISGYHFQEAGADPALELALTLANAKTYLDQLTAKGLPLNKFCHRLSFFFGIGMNFFEEIAKLRAARLLWSEELASRGCDDEKAARMKIHCQTSGWSLTAQDPYNNLMRTTVEAMAAVFGGTQSLHTNAFDEAHALPTETSARLALNTQLILQHEAGVCDVVDPWGGSYMMESMTHQMAEKVRSLLAEIEQQGGVVAAIESGWVMEKIHRHAVATQSQIDKGDQVIVGLNRFATEQDQQPEIFTMDAEALRQQQLAYLQQLKVERDDNLVEQALTSLTLATKGDDNLLAKTIEAIRLRATIGECTQALLRVWPRYHHQPTYSQAVYQQAWSNDTSWRRLQKNLAQYSQKRGRAPSILIAKLGLDGHDRGARVVAAGLRDAGFNVTLSPLFSSPEAVAKKFYQGEFDALGVSILSGSHLPLVDKLSELVDFQTTAVVVGGIVPAQDRDTLREIGVDQVYEPGEGLPLLANELIGFIDQYANLDCLKQQV